MLDVWALAVIALGELCNTSQEEEAVHREEADVGWAIWVSVCLLWDLSLDETCLAFYNVILVPLLHLGIRSISLPTDASHGATLLIGFVTVRGEVIVHWSLVRLMADVLLLQPSLLFEVQWQHLKRAFRATYRSSLCDELG